MARKDASQFGVSPRMDCRQTPESLRELGGQEPGERRFGVAFSLVTLLLATQEKVTRSPEASEKRQGCRATKERNEMSIAAEAAPTKAWQKSAGMPRSGGA